MKRRQMFIGQGAQHVLVLAVWLEDLEVYDAYQIASNLPMGRPEQHLDEFLLHWAIWADSYRILAVFHGNGKLEDVALSLPGWMFEAKIPRGFAQSTNTSQICTRTLRYVTEDFWNELYSLTGARDCVRLGILLRSISGISGIMFLA